MNQDEVTDASHSSWECGALPQRAASGQTGLDDEASPRRKRVTVTVGATFPWKFLSFGLGYSLVAAMAGVHIPDAPEH